MGVEDVSVMLVPVNQLGTEQIRFANLGLSRKSQKC